MKRSVVIFATGEKISSIENPSTKILIVLSINYQYFGEYSLSSKAYQTQGGEDPLFREVACVLLEYGFVHSQPPAIPKYRAGFVITAYEGLKVDWVTIIIDCLKSAIVSLWTGAAQCRIRVYNDRIHIVPLDNLCLGYFCK